MKTAKNKIPVSSIFNGSEGLYGTTVRRFALSVGLLFRAANAFRVTWSERVRHRNALKKPHFRYRKKNKFPERAAEMEMGLGLHQKGALPNVRTEPN